MGFGGGDFRPRADSAYGGLKMSSLDIMVIILAIYGFSLAFVRLVQFFAEIKGQEKQPLEKALRDIIVGVVLMWVCWITLTYEHVVAV